MPRSLPRLTGSASPIPRRSPGRPAARPTAGAARWRPGGPACTRRAAARPVVRSVNAAAKPTTMTAQATYPADIRVMITVTSSAPSTVPSIWLMPISAPSAPRWPTGTRSGSAAVSVASMPPRPSSAMNQPTAMTATAGDAATTSEPGRGDERAAQRPRVAAAARRGRPVRQRADHRVGDQPGDRAHTHHHGQQHRVGPARHAILVRDVVVQRRDLLGQQHLDRCVDPQPEPDVGQEQQRDPAAPDRRGRFRQGCGSVVCLPPRWPHPSLSPGLVVTFRPGRFSGRVRGRRDIRSTVSVKALG